uniref:Secreted protein n=1 Tax=Pseudictyota dubia TaxID=2749911 RepID=A0A7R9W6L7_9STRA
MIVVGVAMSLALLLGIRVQEWLLVSSVSPLSVFSVLELRWTFLFLNAPKFPENASEHHIEGSISGVHISQSSNKWRECNATLMRSGLQAKNWCSGLMSGVVDVHR